MKTKTKNLRSKKDYCLHTFQSYDTIIAKIEYKNNKKKIIFDTYAMEYSRTTNKYLYSFMLMNRQEINKLIKLNQITFKNLNR